MRGICRLGRTISLYGWIDTRFPRAPTTCWKRNVRRSLGCRVRNLVFWVQEDYLFEVAAREEERCI